jgi:hypothetical protein
MFKMWRWKAIELSRETEMDYTDEFEKARKLYPGVKCGLGTEFKRFQKHKDWRVELPKLYPAIEAQIAWRERKKKKNEFVSAWKHFKTWLNNRWWEAELDEEEPSPLSKKQEIEAYKTKVRDRYQYLENKTNEELEYIKFYGGLVCEIAGFYIDEIIEKRRKLGEK